MTDIPQSTVQAFAVAYHRCVQRQGESLFDWNQRQFTAGFEAAIDDGGVVTRDRLAHVVVNVMELDTLRRSEEERTELKQEVRSLRDERKKLYDYVREAAGDESVLVPVSTLELLSESEAHRLRQEVVRLREALRQIRDYTEEFGGPPPEDEMRRFADEVLEHA